MRYIVIPSAKYAPKELSAFYDVPMALYPVNNEPIINLIVRQYNKDDTFIISSYEGFDRVDNYVSKLENCKAIKIDALKDIGFSIYNTLIKIVFKEDDSLVINFADTVIDNNDLTDNAIVYKKPSSISKTWTYLKEQEGIIKSILDKDYQGLDVDGYKLVCGVISIKDPDIFIKILESNNTDAGCDFYKSLQEYSRLIPFDFIKEQNWLDLGHPDEYFRSKLAVKSRSFNHIDFDKNRGIIKKTSDNKDKFINEINWFNKLPKKLQYVIPHIFDYSLDNNNPYLEMEYYSYPTLLELYAYGNLDENQWITIFDRIKFVLNDLNQYRTNDGDISKALRDMYYTKTINRLEALRNNDDFKPFFDKPIFINGKKYISLNTLMAKLDTIVRNNLLKIDEFNVIHGDMCFANILIDDKLNFIKLIDPRGSFGSYDIYGDQRYELAKLFHSVDGKYDLIIKDLFNIEVTDNSINYQFDKNIIDLYPLIKQRFFNLVEDRLKEIEIIEALLFLSMIPLHNENKNHQYMMFATGYEILSRWVDIKEE